MSTVFYSFTTQGVRIHSLGTGSVHYVGHSLAEAKKRFRADFGLQRKRLNFVQI